MSMVGSLRNLILGVTLLMVALGGCGERSEPESSKQPSAVRRKITVAREASAPAAKPSEEKSEKAPTPEAQGRAEPEATIEAKEPEPKVPEKKGMPGPEVKPPSGKREAPTLPVESDMPLLAEGIGETATYSYDPTGKRDPFKPLFQIEAERRARARRRPEKERMPLTPLQKIDLSQLKLVGVILSPRENKAMVEDPKGKGYIIRKGTYIGQNFGRVKEILIDRVIVGEEVEDFVTGEVELRTTELKLQKKLGD